MSDKTWRQTIREAAYYAEEPFGTADLKEIIEKKGIRSEAYLDSISNLNAQVSSALSSYAEEEGLQQVESDTNANMFVRGSDYDVPDSIAETEGVRADLDALREEWNSDDETEDEDDEQTEKHSGEDEDAEQTEKHSGEHEEEKMEEPVDEDDIEESQKRVSRLHIVRRIVEQNFDDVIDMNQQLRSDIRRAEKTIDMVTESLEAAQTRLWVLFILQFTTFVGVIYLMWG